MALGQNEDPWGPQFGFVFPFYQSIVFVGFPFFDQEPNVAYPGPSWCFSLERRTFDQRYLINITS